MLATARSLIADVPFAAARLDGMFDVLIQPVPDALWAGAAQRAVREGDLDAARRLADRVKPDADPLLLADVADLRVRIAEESGEKDQAVADLLDSAALAAMVAEQPQRAIATYEKALDRVADHQAASLHLADALMSDGWGKPLRQAEPQFRHALTLLARQWSLRPVDTETSWSLLTESYLHSLLSGTVTLDVRAAELWRAPLAAARAIAFDPSDGRRWSRLADTLTNLKCRRAALVLSDRACQLTPDDPMVRAARLVALGNQGRAEEALSLLGQAGPEEAAAPSYSAIRAFLLRISAADQPGDATVKLKDALAAADKAVRNQPDGLWFHQVRADLLLDLGATEQAAEEFDHIWREARLDEADGLMSAAQAALELGLGPDAVSLGDQAVGLAEATVTDSDEYLIRGADRIMQGVPGGLSDLAAAVALASTRVAIMDLRERVGRLAGNPGETSGAVDLSGITARISERAAEIEADDVRPLPALARSELDRAASHGRYDPEVSQLATLAAELTGAFVLIAGNDPDGLSAMHELVGRHPEYPELSSAATALAASPKPAAGEPATAPAETAEIEVFLPPSWFAGLSDPMDHEIIKRFIPAARSRLRRSVGETLPGVNFKDDATLEPGGFSIRFRGTVADEGTVSLDRWYCLAGYRAALPGPVQAAAGPATGVAELDCFPVPPHADTLTALVAWPPPEVVARQLERAFAIDKAIAKGNLAEAEREYRVMLAARERQLGADDRATLAARYDLALLLHREGQLSAAETEYRTLVDAQNRLRGPDDLTTLIGRQQLGNLLSEMGRFADAETQQRAILAACERLYGGDNDTTLAVRYGVAGVLQRQGRLADAEAEYRAVLDGQTRAHGVGHPDTLNTRQQLAAVLAEQGRLAEAETEQRAVVTAREQLSGEADPDVLSSRRDLAILLAKQGRLAEAEAEYRALLAVRERLAGADDPAAVLARYDLAGVLYQQGRLDEAEAGYRMVLDAETRLIGADAPDTLVTRRQLAVVLADQGRLAESETEYRAVLAGRERLGGRDDPDTVIARYNVAWVLQRQDKLAEAEAEYRAVLAAESHFKGADAPDTLVTRRELAIVLARQDRLADAEVEYRAVVAARERVLGADDPATITARYEVAGVLQGQGRAADAEAEYRAVVAARERVLGADDPATITARYEVAGVLQGQGRAADAEAEYRAVVAARERVLGADDLDTLLARRQLAVVLADQGRLAEAEAELRSMLAAAAGRFGGDDIVPLAIQYDLAGMLRRQGRLAEAKAEYRAVLDAKTRVKGPDDAETMAVQQQLTAVQAEQARPPEP